MVFSDGALGRLIETPAFYARGFDEIYVFVDRFFPIFYELYSQSIQRDITLEDLTILISSGVIIHELMHGACSSFSNEEQIEDTIVYLAKEGYLVGINSVKYG